MLGHLITHSMVDNLYVHDMYLLVAIILGMLLSRKGFPDQEHFSEGTSILDASRPRTDGA
jgi:hypothetical protein